MSFIPGAIAGALELGIEGFTQPLLNAEALAEAFPGLMEDSLAKPLSELGELADQVGGRFGEAIANLAGESKSNFQEAGNAATEMSGSVREGMLNAEVAMQVFPEWVTAFIANPLLGMIEVAKEAGEALTHAFMHVADDALSIGLAAEKAGVGVEFLSKWSAVAKLVNVDTEMLANGLFMLREHIGEELLNPTKEGAIALQKLGISMEWLKAHATDEEAIFLRVKAGADAMNEGNERAAVLHELMGRGAKELIPLMELHEDKIKQVTEAQRRFGDVTDASEFQAAQSFKMLQVESQMALDGIEKAAMKPILKGLIDHQGEIEVKLGAFSTKAVEEIGKIAKAAEGYDWAGVMDDVTDDIDAIIGDLPQIGAAFVSIGHTVVGVAETLQIIVQNIHEIIRSASQLAAPPAPPGGWPAPKVTGWHGSDAQRAASRLGDLAEDDPDAQSQKSQGFRAHEAALILKELNIHVHENASDDEIGRLVGLAVARALRQRLDSEELQHVSESTGGIGSIY